MIRMRMTQRFFDSRAVLAKVDIAARRVLSKFGAFVRRAARSSIRSRRRASAPGQPPSSHTGLLKRFLWFAYEPQRRNVVIGPARLRRKGRGAAPSLLECGGVLRQGLAGQGRSKRKRVVKIRPRPFMGPAFEKEQPRLPAMWADSIR